MIKMFGLVTEEEQEVQRLWCCKIYNVHISDRLYGSLLLLCRYSRCTVSKPTQIPQSCQFNFKMLLVLIELRVREKKIKLFTFLSR